MQMAEAPDQWTTDRVRWLFRSGRGAQRGDHRDYHRLSYCLNNGMVSVRRDRYDSVPVPGPSNAFARGVYQHAGRAAQSKRHHDLKWQAWNWCHDRFGEVPEFEWGNHDLVARRGRIVIECGNTTPKFAFDLFFRHNERGEITRYLESFVLLPFFDYGPTFSVFELTAGGEKLLLEYAKWKWEYYCWSADRARHGTARPQPIIPNEPANLGCSQPSDGPIYSVPNDAG